ncbi:ABC transporter substrate-binding protein [Glaciibacter psychrotolerans]|uniref:Polar amino acid transport system substrate-binding protein n=1 Tax=Glaciibacter psychrotolerans TaxID=670054 RepID=A0A7Z0EB03_9MICO|nr:ABC transporter substrate-binding protein [Leifsonia psychrotolerans]NYJ18238.1 polar amino acid transport system substrate-binding protein [Leifsonia psychrotolerans]
MRHKGLLLVPAALTTTLLLAACGASESAVQANGNPASYGDCEVTGTAGEYTLDTLTENTLLMKADLPSPGWYNGDTVEDIRSGFDFCLLVNIAHRAGIDNVKLQMASFDGLVAGKSGDMDLSLNQITITDERKKVMDFSDPYFQSTAGVLVKVGSDVTEKNLAQQSLGVKQGTVGQILVADTFPSTSPAVFPGDSEQQAAVLAGTVDAGIQDLSIVLGAAAKSGGKLEVVGQIETDEAYGIMMAKGSPNLGTINKILADLKADGTLDKLSAAYLADAYGIDPASIPVWHLK